LFYKIRPTAVFEQLEHWSHYDPEKCVTFRNYHIIWTNNIAGPNSVAEPWLRKLLRFFAVLENWILDLACNNDENVLETMERKFKHSFHRNVETRCQSYKRNLVLKKSILVLNYLTMRYIKLDYTTVLLWSNWSNASSRNY